jgi:hypothetical protein
VDEETPAVMAEGVCCSLYSLILEKPPGSLVIGIGLPVDFETFRLNPNICPIHESLGLTERMSLQTRSGKFWVL